MTNVLIVPGAAVRSYVRPAAEALRDRGVEVQLLAASGEPDAQADLRHYGQELAHQINRDDPIDLLIGLSVGAQVAAVAATTAKQHQIPSRVRHLMLISPTVDPQIRTTPRLLGRWLAGGRLERPALFLEQFPEWRRAGPRRLLQVVRSAVTVCIEDLLPNLRARLTVVRGENDVITSHSYAAGLATDHGGELLVVPNATHSWPYADANLRRHRPCATYMSRHGSNRLAPQDVVASFDSATVLHASVGAALRGQPFPHLGHSAIAAAVVRVAGRLPWPVLRRVYTRIGAAEGIDPHRLADVDMATVARCLAEGYPHRRYPAALIGSSNGALAHLAAALQVPWLPGTVLVPVARRGDPLRPVDALHFGQRFAPRLLDANPDVVLHHMHDQIQDELMVARMTYFRTKWRQLPKAYARFLTDCLAPGAPVILVEDVSCWPVVRVGERHVFQAGAHGGRHPHAYLRRPHTPQVDDQAPEAEWGADPDLVTALTAWCNAHGHPLVRLNYSGPQAPAHAVAAVLRDWYAKRGEPADRLLVPSFILGDPWRTINAAAVPFWTFFPVQPALKALETHLETSAPYRTVDILLFQHGVHSEGIAYPAQWLEAVQRHGANARLLAIDRRRFPHDIASLGRYGRALADLPPAQHPWSPLDVDEATHGLRTAGLHINALSGSTITRFRRTK